MSLCRFAHHLILLALIAGWTQDIWSQTGSPAGMVIHHLHQDDWHPDGLPLGGWSGICFDPERRVYYAISDKEPARFYTIQVDSFGAVPSVIAETLIGFGKGLEPRNLDPEAIHIHPDGQHLYWSNEANSTVYRMDLNGRVDRQFVLPRDFQPDQQGRGIRSNSGLESLAISPDGSTLVVATEHLLKQDEPCASEWMAPYQPLRLVMLSIESGQIIHEYLYFAENGHGLVDLFWKENEVLLCLERSWSPLTGNHIVVFESDWREATDIREAESLCDLDPETTHPVKSRLICDLQAGRKSGLNPYIDNVEGLTLGPVATNGRRPLVLVSDDNFSSKQVTQFIQILLPD